MKKSEQILLFLKKRYILVAFIMSFVVGLVVSKDYGTYFDQESEINILYSNVKAYSEAIPIVGELTNSFFEDKNVIEPIGQSDERDHGVAVYLPLFILLQQNSDNGQYVNLIQHLYSFVVFFLGVLSLFYLSKKISKSKLFAFIIAMLFFLTPRFFAEGHYNNKDVMLLSLMIMVFALGYSCIEKPTIVRCILFAAVGALASNIKIVGFIAPGIIGIIYTIYIFNEEKKEKRRERFYKAMFTIVLFAFFYWAITPAMWSGMQEYFSYLFNNAIMFSRWDGQILFNGEIYRHSTTGLPKQYAIVQYLITTPLFISLLALAGAMVLMFDMFKNRKIKIFWQDSGNLLIIFGTISSLLFMIYAIFSKMVLYNSWRHLYFCYIGILFSILYLFKRISKEDIKNKTAKFLFFSVLSLYFGCTIIGLILNHPYQYAYFNMLAGQNVEEKYEIDYWCVSIANALNKLCETVPDGKIEILGLEWCADWRVRAAINILPEEIQERFVVYNMETNPKEGMYILENPTYSDMHAHERYEAARESSEKIIDIKAYGNSIMKIYKKY